MGAVIKNQANMTLGFISQTIIRNQFMTPSYIHHTSHLVWITPPGRLFTSFEKLIKPFRYILWVCFLGVFMLTFVVIRVVKCQRQSVQKFVFGEGNTTPCLNVFNVFFGGSLHKLPVRNFARTLLGLFMIYCLIIRSSYQGKFMIFLEFSPEFTVHR